ncbi:MAG: MgtC/SapB family protein [Pseudoxanthomonas suwonensis]|nr:MgtC/SapB family protein [Pseudoxanthomonas suwonensis]
MDTFSVIGQTLAAEFDLPDAATTTRIVTRLLVAALLGALIGWERERGGHPAGLRTHILVSMGAALFVLGPWLAGVETDALSRVMQGIVQGIGFIGAGAIIKQATRGTETIHGLTSAAGIWLAAAIGMTAGMGREAGAIIATLIALVVLGLLPKVVDAGMGDNGTDSAGNGQGG